LSHFEKVPNVVSVGPLTYNPSCVRQGPPMVGLKGDILFLALRMGLECPPLPVGRKNEFTIFTRFFLKQPRVTAQTWSLLSKEFLEKADSKTIFPSRQAC
jgi:hypothetical protein